MSRPPTPTPVAASLSGALSCLASHLLRLCLSLSLSMSLATSAELEMAIDGGAGESVVVTRTSVFASRDLVSPSPPSGRAARLCSRLDSRGAWQLGAGSTANLGRPESARAGTATATATASAARVSDVVMSTYESVLGSDRPSHQSLSAVKKYSPVFQPSSFLLFFPPLLSPAHHALSPSPHLLHSSSCLRRPTPVPRPICRCKCNYNRCTKHIHTAKHRRKEDRIFEF